MDQQRLRDEITHNFDALQRIFGRYLSTERDRYALMRDRAIIASEVMARIGFSPMAWERRRPSTRNPIPLSRKQVCLPLSCCTAFITTC